ncbi:MAG: pyrimidine-nucleoside phosphorylase [Firmicutes bacterium]|nr:pyrimidine-nucleoside phosphorylase [Bacillota bacterium]
MRVYDLILKKRNGGTLQKEEIDFLVSGFMDNSIPDYQISALLMAICLKGLDRKETADLTMSIVNSGDIIDLSEIPGVKVDKHSTGGVGDKISLIVIPLVASLGIPVAKISGRGLGHTGGTIDKLESIEGFKAKLNRKEFISNVKKCGMAITGQSEDIAPADRKLYALRDVTATIDSIPLISSSIMSKKIASGAEGIVLDIKVGTGAFMKSLSDALELARVMINIGKELNKKIVAVITDMNQPLGHEIGNANEVKEAVKVLSGEGPEDVTAIALTIASYMAILGGASNNFKNAYKILKDTISSGIALNKFKELIIMQNGNPSFIDNFSLLPQAKYHIDIKSNFKGFVEKIDAEKIGIAAMMLGAGRKKKDDLIDYAAGITIAKKVGDEININETLCTLHTNKSNYNESAKLVLDSYTFKNEPCNKNKYIYDIIQ